MQKGFENAKSELIHDKSNTKVKVSKDTYIAYLYMSILSDQLLTSFNKPL